jgi:hypothetical protein
MYVMPVARAERSCLAAAGAAAGALLVYALLQIAGACGLLGAPAEAVPLFWRLEVAAAAGALAAPGLWGLAGAAPAVRRRVFSALLGAALGATGLCAVLCP